MLGLGLLALLGCARGGTGLTSIRTTDIREIRLDRFGCGFWGCPVYSLAFQSDGSATYYGRFCVSRLGHYKGRTDFGVIAAWLDSQDLDKFANGYALGGVDAEMVRLTVVRDSRTKSISSDNAALLPPKVTGIINALDGFSDQVRWQPAGALESYLGTFIYYSQPGLSR